jgi:hypothetical protein
VSDWVTGGSPSEGCSARDIGRLPFARGKALRMLRPGGRFLQGSIGYASVGLPSVGEVTCVFILIRASPSFQVSDRDLLRRWRAAAAEPRKRKGLVASVVERASRCCLFAGAMVAWNSAGGVRNIESSFEIPNPGRRFGGEIRDSESTFEIPNPPETFGCVKRAFEDAFRSIC